MGLTPDGKIICYINNWDGEKSNLGKTGLTETYYNLYRTGSTDSHDSCDCYRNTKTSDGGNYSHWWGFRQIIDKLDMSLIFSNVKTDRVWSWNDGTVDTQQLQIITSGTYNRDYEEVSYENPIVLHYTKTFQNTTSGSITVYGLWLCSDMYSYHDPALEKWLLEDFYDDPVVVAPGDKVTFTVTVK